jgi:hypothetical protein
LHIFIPIDISYLCTVCTTAKPFLDLLLVRTFLQRKNKLEDTKNFIFQIICTKFLKIAHGFFIRLLHVLVYVVAAAVGTAAVVIVVAAALI